MRIAFLSPVWPALGAQNGIATYVDIITRALTALGHECVVMTGRLEGEAESGVEAVKVQMPEMPFLRGLADRVRFKLGAAGILEQRRWGLGVAQALEAISAQKRIDVCEVEESFGYAHFIRPHSSIPVVIRAHGPHFLVHQGSLEANDTRRIAVEEKAFHDANAASFPTEALRNAVAERYPGAVSLTATFPNPIDAPGPSDCWSETACDENLIAFIGRFDSVKGSDLALQAFSKLLEVRPEARLLMAGADFGLKDADGSLLKFADYARAHLSDQARSRVTFLGPRPRGEIPALRRKAALCLCASRYETFPYAVTEALAQGCPVVSTRTAGLGEYLNDGEHVLFAPVGDGEALFEKMRLGLQNRQLAQKIALAGRKLALERFSPDAVARQAIEFYERAARQGPERK